MLTCKVAYLIPLLLVMHTVARAEELVLINEHLQEQLATSQTERESVSEDVHRLSLSLSETQERLRETERECRGHLAVSRHAHTHTNNSLIHTHTHTHTTHTQHTQCLSLS